MVPWSGRRPHRNGSSGASAAGRTAAALVRMPPWCVGNANALRYRPEKIVRRAPADGNPVGGRHAPLIDGNRKCEHGHGNDDATTGNKKRAANARRDISSCLRRRSKKIFPIFFLRSELLIILIRIMFCTRSDSIYLFIRFIPYISFYYDYIRV